MDIAFIDFPVKSESSDSKTLYIAEIIDPDAFNSNWERVGEFTSLINAKCAIQEYAENKAREEYENNWDGADGFFYEGRIYIVNEQYNIDIAFETKLVNSEFSIHKV